MNGHFEQGRSTYPIAFLKNQGGDGYKITDMRKLEALDAPAVNVRIAERVAHRLNENLRSGAYSGEKYSAIHQDCVTLIAQEQAAYSED